MQIIHILSKTHEINFVEIRIYKVQKIDLENSGKNRNLFCVYVSHEEELWYIHEEDCTCMKGVHSASEMEALDRLAT